MFSKRNVNGLFSAKCSMTKTSFNSENVLDFFIAKTNTFIIWRFCDFFFWLSISHFRFDNRVSFFSHISNKKGLAEKTLVRRVDREAAKKVMRKWNNWKLMHFSNMAAASAAAIQFKLRSKRSHTTASL
jgi:hypothetical protein